MNAIRPLISAPNYPEATSRSSCCVALMVGLLVGFGAAWLATRGRGLDPKVRIGMLAGSALIGGLAGAALDRCRRRSAGAPARGERPRPTPAPGPAAPTRGAHPPGGPAIGPVVPGHVGQPPTGPAVAPTVPVPPRGVPTAPPAAPAPAPRASSVTEDSCRISHGSIALPESTAHIRRLTLSDLHASECELLSHVQIPSLRVLQITGSDFMAPTLQRFVEDNRRIEELLLAGGAMLFPEQLSTALAALGNLQRFTTSMAADWERLVASSPSLTQLTLIGEARDNPPSARCLQRWGFGPPTSSGTTSTYLRRGAS